MKITFATNNLQITDFKTWRFRHIRIVKAEHNAINIERLKTEYNSTNMDVATQFLTHILINFQIKK
jgi:hypothetical protein